MRPRVGGGRQSSDDMLFDQPSKRQKAPVCGRWTPGLDRVATRDKAADLVVHSTPATAAGKVVPDRDVRSNLAHGQTRWLGGRERRGSTGRLGGEIWPGLRFADDRPVRVVPEGCRAGRKSYYLRAYLLSRKCLLALKASLLLTLPRPAAGQTWQVLRRLLLMCSERKRL